MRTWPNTQCFVKKTRLAAPQDVSVDADGFDTFEHIPGWQKCKNANSFFSAPVLYCTFTASTRSPPVNYSFNTSMYLVGTASARFVFSLTRTHCDIAASAVSNVSR